MPRMSKDELYDRAEALANENLCMVKCLCPNNECSQCDVFYSLREYYVEQYESKDKQIRQQLRKVNIG